jgi:hypothetical protein
MTKTVLAIGLVVGAIIGVLVMPRAKPVQSGGVSVPDVGALPKLDGELDEPLWQAPVVRTGAFVDPAGGAARPYSDARIAWANGSLVVALYAADEDIRTSGPAADVFHVTLGDTSFDVTPTGELRGAPAGTTIGHDADGTIDDPSNDDEEWVLELVVPLRSLGLEGKPGERISFSAERCDTTHDGVRRCGATRKIELVLGPPWKRS